MSNIDKHALIAKIKKQTESFDTVVLKEDEAKALLDEMEASQSENERLAKALIERNGEPVGGLVKRVAELEEIASDYGMKFQRAQDALKHQSLLHKSQMEVAEKRIADYQELISGLVGVSSSILREVERINNAAAAGKGE